MEWVILGMNFRCGYETVHENTPAETSRKVSELMNRGYHLHGDLQTVGGCYVQAMMLIQEVKEKEHVDTVAT